MRKSSTATEQETTQRADPKQCKLRGEVARQTGQNFTHHLPPLHVQQSDRTETSIFCLQNDATVRRTVTTFVCPQTQFHENLHTNFALQNLPNRGREGKAMIAKRILNELEKYAHPSSWLMGKIRHSHRRVWFPMWELNCF